MGKPTASLMSDACASAPSTARGKLAPLPLTRNRYLLTMHHWFAQILLAQSFCYGLSARIRRILQGVDFAAL